MHTGKRFRNVMKAFSFCAKTLYISASSASEVQFGDCAQARTEQCNSARSTAQIALIAFGFHGGSQPASRADASLCHAFPTCLCTQSKSKRAPRTSLPIYSTLGARLGEARVLHGQQGRIYMQMPFLEMNENVIPMQQLVACMYLMNF